MSARIDFVIGMDAVGALVRGIGWSYVNQSALSMLARHSPMFTYSGDRAMASPSFFRALQFIVTFALIAIMPAGCGDPCRDCKKIDCSGSDIDCSRSDMDCRDTDHSSKAECELRKAECEAKKKETMRGCEEYKALCFKACNASSSPPARL
jgi:hypothetical protein